MNMAEWSNLPFDLVQSIGNRLGAIEDFLSFSAVCSSWRSASPRKDWAPSVPRLPWLMLAESQTATATTATTTTTRGFFSLHSNKRYDLEVPETHGRRCWGSQIGWIFTVGLDLETHVVNPLTRARIPLPPLSTLKHQPKDPKPPEWFRKSFIRKAVVFYHGASSSIVVVAIYGHLMSHLAFARPGYTDWVPLEEKDTPLKPWFEDVVCYGPHQQIFGVRWDGSLVICDIESDAPSVVDFAPPLELIETWEKIYLVESNGELLMVVRLCRGGLSGYKTESFEVFKFDFGERKWSDEELDDLGGDRALFMGDSYSMSLSSGNCHGLKRNGIYFTDDSYTQWDRCGGGGGGGHDMGIFDVEEDTFEPHYVGDDARSCFSPPIWVVPGLT